MHVALDLVLPAKHGRAGPRGPPLIGRHLSGGGRLLSAEVGVAAPRCLDRASAERYRDRRYESAEDEHDREYAAHAAIRARAPRGLRASAHRGQTRARWRQMNSGSDRRAQASAVSSRIEIGCAPAEPSGRADGNGSRSGCYQAPWLRMGFTLKSWCRKFIQQRKNSAGSPANAPNGLRGARSLSETTLKGMADQVQHDCSRVIPSRQASPRSRS